MSDQPLPHYLTVDEVAALVRLHRNWVSRNAARLGGIRCGNRWRFTLADVEAGMASLKATPPPDATPTPQPAPLPPLPPRPPGAASRVSSLSPGAAARLRQRAS